MDQQSTNQKLSEFDLKWGIPVPLESYLRYCENINGVKETVNEEDKEYQKYLEIYGHDHYRYHQWIKEQFDKIREDIMGTESRISALEIGDE